MAPTYKMITPSHIEATVPLTRDETPARKPWYKVWGKILFRILVIVSLVYIAYVNRVWLLQQAGYYIQKLADMNTIKKPACPREVRRVIAPEAVVFGPAALSEHPDPYGWEPLYVLREGDPVEYLCESHQFERYERHRCWRRHWPDGTVLVHVGYNHVATGISERREGWMLMHEISWY